MTVKNLAEKYKDYMIEKRRYFHQYPELSLEEKNTTEAIVKELTDMGMTVQTLPGIYGCVGILKGGRPGPTVLLRCDIDGLSVQEETGLPFASENQGKMHACGHDSHMAMQLGAAKILTELKDELSGSVKFFFQPAEEVAQGAKYYIAHGLLDDVSACYGMHIWGGMDSAKMNIQSGERMASCDSFHLTIHGTSAHGSAPNLGKDALLASSAVIMALQSIVSRVNNPLNALVITIGTLNGGQRFNVIADKVEMDAAVRTFDRDFRMSVEKMIREVAEQTAKAYGCTAELEYHYLTGAVINDNEQLVQIAQNAAVSLFGEELLIPMEKMTGSEDFSFLTEKVPGVYAFIGATSCDVPGSEQSNHHEKFTVDEKALYRGAAVAAQFAFDYLKDASNKKN